MGYGAVIETYEVGGIKVGYRVAGDTWLLVEYGDMVLDLFTNFRVMALSDYLTQVAPIDGIQEKVPGLRSLLLNYDPLKLNLDRLVSELKAIEEKLPPVDQALIPSRSVELPIAFEDKWTRADIERYQRFVRSDAPNVIDGHNIKYIAQFNGLDVEELIDLITGTEWWTGMIGFWPGLPFLWPMDPRCVISVPKYNPTRPWTPEGAVGIGGPCVAIYPVPSPGGYQLFGRTIRIWDAEQKHPAYKDSPVLLRPGDRIKFIRSTEEEIIEINKRIEEGTYRYRISEYTVFSVAAYKRFCESVRAEAEEFALRRAEAQKNMPVP